MQEESLPSSFNAISDRQSTTNTKGLHYEKAFRITFAETNAEGNMSHYEYAKYFGIVRELFAMDMVPNFIEDAGRKYLLKTRNASYKYMRDFFFGDMMTVRLRLGELNKASLKLEAEFINSDTNVVHATGVQEIVYTDLKGMPRRIPDELISFLKFAL